MTVDTHDFDVDSCAWLRLGVGKGHRDVHAAAWAWLCFEYGVVGGGDGVDDGQPETESPVVAGAVRSEPLKGL